MLGAGARRHDPRHPSARNGFGARGVAWEDLLAGARIRRAAINLPQCGDLSFRQTLGCITCFTNHRARIEIARSRIFDESIFHTVQRITSRKRCALDGRQLGRRNWTLRQRSFIPDEPREQVRPVVRWRSGNDALEIFRIALRLHESLTPAIGTTVEIAPSLTRGQKRRAG